MLFFWIHARNFCPAATSQVSDAIEVIDTRVMVSRQGPAARPYACERGHSLFPKGKMARGKSEELLDAEQANAVRDELQKLKDQLGTQGEVAKRVGVSQQTISKALDPRHPIGVRLFLRLKSKGLLGQHAPDALTQTLARPQRFSAKERAIEAHLILGDDEKGVRDAAELVEGRLKARRALADARIWFDHIDVVLAGAERQSTTSEIRGVRRKR